MREVDFRAETLILRECLKLQRLYAERARLKKEVRMIDTMKANADDFLKPIFHLERAKE